MKRLANQGVRVLTAFDWPLLALLIIMAVLGLTIMHSAVGGTDWRFAEQTRNFVVAFAAMWIAAALPPPLLMRLSPYVYAVGVILLIGMEFFCETSKGATRWLDLGAVRIQPSEKLTISVPMLLDWYFHKNKASLRLRDFFVASLLLVIPFILIVRQPDLGTALLVFDSGFFVSYFGGLSFKLLVPLFVGGALLIGGVIYYEEQICQPDVD